MRVALINPKFRLPIDTRTSPHLALAYLGAVSERRGDEVRVYDADVEEQPLVDFLQRVQAAPGRHHDQYAAGQAGVAHGGRDQGGDGYPDRPGRPARERGVRGAGLRVAAPAPGGPGRARRGRRARGSRSATSWTVPARPAGVHRQAADGPGAGPVPRHEGRRATRPPTGSSTATRTRRPSRTSTACPGRPTTCSR